MVTDVRPGVENVLCVTGESIERNLACEEIVVHRLVDAVHSLVISEMALAHQSQQHRVLQLLIEGHRPVVGGGGVAGGPEDHNWVGSRAGH